MLLCRHLIIFFLIFQLMYCRRGGKRGRDNDETKTQRVKCNLRMEYWDKDVAPSLVVEPIIHAQYQYSNNWILVAVAKMYGQGTFKNWTKDGQGLQGIIKFEQQRYRRPMRITANLSNLMPDNEHGLFILEYGRRRCNKLGGYHFNPTNSSHGRAQSCNRHHGDLETITSDQSGTVLLYEQWDPRIQLQGPTTIIGRSVALLLIADDENEEFYRVGCGIIGFAKDTNFTINTFHTPSVEDEPFPVYLVIAISTIFTVGCIHIFYSYTWLNVKDRYKFTDKNVEYFHKRRIMRVNKLQTSYISAWDEKGKKPKTHSIHLAE